MEEATSGRARDKQAAPYPHPRPWAWGRRLAIQPRACTWRAARAGPLGAEQLARALRRGRRPGPWQKERVRARWQLGDEMGESFINFVLTSQFLSPEKQ